MYTYILSVFVITCAAEKGEAHAYQIPPNYCGAGFEQVPIVPSNQTLNLFTAALHLLVVKQHVGL